MNSSSKKKTVRFQMLTENDHLLDFAEENKEEHHQKSAIGLTTTFEFISSHVSEILEALFCFFITIAVLLGMGLILFYFYDLY